jgi:hypothetical protein
MRVSDKRYNNTLNFCGNRLQSVKQSLGKQRTSCESNIKVDLTQRGCADETRGELDQDLV